MSKAKTDRSHEDFQPLFDWKREDGFDTLAINLPGFKKEQLRIQALSCGKMKISGERQIDGNKWSRFQKDFHVPENCNQCEISAKFENGTLNMTMPRTATQVCWSTLECCKPGGGGFFFGLNMSRKVVLGMVVVSLVGVALGIYVACNVRCVGRFGN
ncbi:inactive protein RESTRICTED TEV MOVEMENT 2-like [Magnolia sinica]|uniref:inactive protein RESTRICTED TEV MOVEMENT 2-like n=1 Tax=Magnolia sinica TaxID=86752 RepID=UPI00265A03F9|nr:inactive protein RESTRICTED TEV MOVEMENT 2-like [Magnolia sinica]